MAQAYVLVQIQSSNDDCLYLLQNLDLELIISHQLGTSNRQKSIENYLLPTIVTYHHDLWNYNTVTQWNGLNKEKKKEKKYNITLSLCYDGQYMWLPFFHIPVQLIFWDYRFQKGSTQPLEDNIGKLLVMKNSETWISKLISVSQ